MNTARTMRYGVIATIMAVLCAAIAVPSYAAYEDTLEAYWKMDDLSYDDDFSGASYDTGRWTLSYPTGSSITLNSGKSRLYIDADGENRFDYLKSNLHISGDFDIQVDWTAVTLPNASPSGINYCSLYVDGQTTSGGTNYAQIRMTKSESSQYYILSYRVDGIYGQTVPISTTDMSGKFRLTRSGSTFTGYYWQDDAWQSAGQLVNGWTLDTRTLAPVLTSNAPSTNDLTVDFDSFSINTGEKAIDASGSNIGKIYGATQTTGKTGYNTALNFDGVDDYVLIQDSSTLSSSSKTLAVWVKADTLGTNDIIAGKGGEEWLTYNYRAIGSADRFGFSVYDGDWKCATSAAQPVAGEWYFLTGIYDGSNISLYVNGVLQGSPVAQGSPSDTGELFAIGAGQWDPAWTGFDGTIDDVSLWSRALDANEISMLYDLGTDKFEWLTVGINDANELDLGYSTSELKLLADLYAKGTIEASETIGDLTWHYLSGDLPGDIGGTTYDYGDTWVYEGKYYIKLGSGLEGSSVPEPGCAFGLLMGFFVPGFRRLLKRRVRG